jgi:hypothetical protein
MMPEMQRQTERARASSSSANKRHRKFVSDSENALPAVGVRVLTWRMKANWQNSRERFEAEHATQGYAGIANRFVLILKILQPKFHTTLRLAESSLRIVQSKKCIFR